MSRIPTAAPPIPGFEYADLLGGGGFSDVYRYTELGLGRSVAVKVLLADVDQASFRSEAKLMAQLGNHPSIVSIYQAGITAEGRAFLVMEFCPPPHLGLRLRIRPLAVAKALEVAVQLAGAVETAHKQGILHRDIKPANILFTEFGRPALTDFGIAEVTGRAEAGQGVGMSPPWAPPEQLRVGAPMSAASDVYSLAATLWTSLVGRSPFSVPSGANDAGAIAQRIRTQPPPRTGRADVPDSLEGVLRVAMAKQPHERFGTALQLARALQAVQAELHQSVTAIDVRDEPLDLAESSEEKDYGGTHITGFVAIDPDGRSAGADTRLGSSGPSEPAAGTSPPPAAGFGTASTGVAGSMLDDADTALSASTGTSLPAGRFVIREAAAPRPTSGSGPGPGPAEGTPGPAPATRSRLLVGAAAALVVGTVGFLALTHGGGSDANGTTPDGPVPSSTGAPQDPTVETVPAPTNVTVTRAAGRLLQLRWTNPAPEAGDVYLYKLDDPVSPRPWQQTGATMATLQGAPGRLCVVVAILRADHRPTNEPARACVGGAT